MGNQESTGAAQKDHPIMAFSKMTTEIMKQGLTTTSSSPEDNESLTVSNSHLLNDSKSLMKQVKTALTSPKEGAESLAMFITTLPNCLSNLIALIMHP
jgi:hypothetical protein